MVIAATQGTTSADLAAGNTLAQANAYTDIKLATGGGGGGGGTAEVVVTTRAAINTLADGDGLVAGDLFLITDETPERFVVATADNEYVNFVPVSTYRPPAPIGDLRTIAEENALDGYPVDDWQIAGPATPAASATRRRCRCGPATSIDFKIHSGDIAYTLDIVRLGWYGGAGARLVDTLTNSGKLQTNGNLRPTGEGGVGSRDCSNWTSPTPGTVPVDATNGVYLGVIKRTGGGHVRTSARSSSTTNSATRRHRLQVLRHDVAGLQLDAAPSTTRRPANRCTGRGRQLLPRCPRLGRHLRHSAADQRRGLPNVVLERGTPDPLFLEHNGYNVHYITVYDVDRDPTRLLGHKVIVMCGHDEYWSQNVRDAWDAAIAAGLPRHRRSPATRCCGGSG